MHHCTPACVTRAKLRLKNKKELSKLLFYDTLFLLAVYPYPSLDCGLLKDRICPHCRPGSSTIFGHGKHSVNISGANRSSTCRYWARYFLVAYQGEQYSQHSLWSKEFGVLKNDRQGSRQIAKQYVVSSNEGMKSALPKLCLYDRKKVL